MEQVGYRIHRMQIYSRTRDNSEGEGYRGNNREEDSNNKGSNKEGDSNNSNNNSKEGDNRRRRQHTG